MDDLKKFERFIKLNLSIKKAMVECSPDHINGNNNEYIVMYSDKLYKTLKDIEIDILNMISLYPMFDNDKEYVKKLFQIYYDELSKASSNFMNLKKFYIGCISNLSQDIVDKVGQNCVGYSWGPMTPSLRQAHSINELLHITHQRIINNDAIYHQMPILRQKTNEIGELISLRGNTTNIGNEIFNSIPNDLDLGTTDILAIDDNTVFLMIRDRGHALTIEIEQENNKYYIRYFIPKICNINMVNKLNGVRKVNKESEYTTGIFETTKENINTELIRLISGVPTDFDMDNALYSEEPIINKR